MKHTQDQLSNNIVSWGKKIKKIKTLVSMKNYDESTQTFYAIVKSIWSGTISYIVNIEIYHTSMEYLNLCVVFFLD